ncbi:MAG: hypothetical protein ACI9HK_006119 [Pirellulaceae bacterium]|jgi:hypothetical protein
MRSRNYDQASDFLDSLTSPKSRSAAIAIHLTWLNSFGSPEQAIADKAKDTDLLLLYRAMVNTFEINPGTEQSAYDRRLSVTDVVESARSRQKTPDDTRIKSYAMEFVKQLQELDATPSKDVVDFYVQLFLDCVHSEKVLDAIETGQISDQSNALRDPELW